MGQDERERRCKLSNKIQLLMQLKEGGEESRLHFTFLLYFLFFKILMLLAGYGCKIVSPQAQAQAGHAPPLSMHLPLKLRLGMHLPSGSCSCWACTLQLLSVSCSGWACISPQAAPPLHAPPLLAPLLPDPPMPAPLMHLLSGSGWACTSPQALAIHHKFRWLAGQRGKH
jgi:hypothetical protein